MTYKLLDKSSLLEAQNSELVMNDLLSSCDADKFIRFVIKSHTKSPLKFIQSHRIEFQDLIQIGRIGLYKGIINLKLSLDEKEIQRYLYLRIQGELHVISRSNGSNLVTVPQRIRDLYSIYLKFKQDFYSIYYRNPNISEVMNKFELSEEDAYDLVYGMQENSSNILENKYGIVSLFDYLECHLTSSIEDKVIKRILLEEKLAVLNPLDRTVIVMKYFLDYNNTEIAKYLGCAISMVSKYIRRAFQSLGIDEVKVARKVGTQYRTLS